MADIKNDARAATTALWCLRAFRAWLVLATPVLATCFVWLSTATYASVDMAREYTTLTARDLESRQAVGRSARNPYTIVLELEAEEHRARSEPEGYAPGTAGHARIRSLRTELEETRGFDQRIVQEAHEAWVGQLAAHKEARRSLLVLAAVLALPALVAALLKMSIWVWTVPGAQTKNSPIMGSDNDPRDLVRSWWRRYEWAACLLGAVSIALFAGPNALGLLAL